MKVGQAMQEAGFSQAQSKKGFSEIMKRPGLKKALQKEMDKFISETDGLPGAAERAKLIRWRLTKNIVTGKDAAVAQLQIGWTRQGTESLPKRVPEQCDRGADARELRGDYGRLSTNRRLLGCVPRPNVR